jgi:uncharacterized protein (DUF1501 family)
MEPPAFDRRQALGLLGLGAFALGASRAHAAVRPCASAHVAGGGPLAEARTLLLVQLSGGNDGLSMVVPHGDDAYHAARPTLRQEQVLALDDYRGLHPALVELRALFDAGRLAIVEGVGYPEPSRSHFTSFDVWHTADRRGRTAGDGWIGRLCSAAWPTSEAMRVVHVGGTAPYALHSSTHPPACVATPAGYRWAGDEGGARAYESAGETSGEGTPASLEFLRKTLADGQASSRAIRAAAARYRPRAEYPNDPFAAALRDVAALAQAGLGTRVFSVELGGFDTHSSQRGRHDALMRRLDAALGAFCADVAGSQASRELVILVYSEFGRRVRENGSRGTDHGVAGPLLLLGEPVAGGLFGRHPSLAQLDEGDLVHTTDFRSIYATVLQGCFGLDHERVLGARYPLLPLLA